MNPQFFHHIHLGIRRIRLPGNNGAGMAHAASRGRRYARDKSDHRLAHVFLRPVRCIDFLRTADLANHDDGIGIRVLLESTQHGHKIGTVDRVTANTDRGRLSHSQRRHLLHGLVVQGPGAGYHADTSRRVDM